VFLSSLGGNEYSSPLRFLLDDSYRAADAHADRAIMGVRIRSQSGAQRQALCIGKILQKQTIGPEYRCLILHAFNHFLDGAFAAGTGHALPCRIENRDFLKTGGRLCVDPHFAG